MKLTGNLKKQVEKAESKDEKKSLIENAGMLLNDDELEMVSGGAKGKTGKFEAWTIGNIAVFSDYPKSESQVLQRVASVNGTIYVSGKIINVDYWRDNLSMAEIIEPMRGWVFSDSIRIINSHKTLGYFK